MLDELHFAGKQAIDRTMLANKPSTQLIVVCDCEERSPSRYLWLASAAMF